MDISIPHINDSSIDTTNTGIVHSPDFYIKSRKGNWDYRCPNTDDEDLPSTMTRPPTVVTDGSGLDYELGLRSNNKLVRGRLMMPE